MCARRPKHREIYEYAEAASSYAQLIERAQAARYAAELSAREAEWDVLRRDLNDKRAAWREAGGLILSCGRADFQKGDETIRARYASWSARFADEYGARAAVWTFTEVGMNDKKLQWVAQATNAANKASTGAILALVGADAEAAVRGMDAFSVSDLSAESGASEFGLPLSVSSSTIRRYAILRKVGARHGAERDCGPKPGPRGQRRQGAQYVGQQSYEAGAVSRGRARGARQ